jgi:hypothetical protein
VSQTGRVLFFPGQVVATPGTLEAIHASGEPAYDFLRASLDRRLGRLERHRQSRERIVRAGRLPHSVGLHPQEAYTLKTGVKIWIITEADRSATTLLLPGEY